MFEAIASNLPIVLSMVVGIVLLVVEAFMPGFGVAGFFGVVLEIAAVVMTYLTHGVTSALVVLLIGLAVVALAISMSLRSIAKGRLSESGMVLKNTERSEEGYMANEDLGVFLGRVGTATTALRPTGMADFDGVKLNVMSDGTFVEAGVQVKITRVDGGKVVVVPV